MLIKYKTFMELSWNMDVILIYTQISKDIHKKNLNI